MLEEISKASRKKGNSLEIAEISHSNRMPKRWKDEKLLLWVYFHLNVYRKEIYDFSKNSNMNRK